MDFVKGHPRNPLDMEEMEEKFRKCLQFSSRPPGEEKVSALIKTMKDLDTLENISPLLQYLK